MSTSNFMCRQLVVPAGKDSRPNLTKSLEQTRRNKTAAARLLGITFRSLRYRLERLGIE